MANPLYQAVLSGGETKMTPSPLTNKNGTVRLVVYKVGEISKLIFDRYIKS